MSATRHSLSAVRAEGGLLTLDFIERIRGGDRDVPGLTPESYGESRQARLGDAIQRSWAVLLERWREFAQDREELGETEAARTTRVWLRAVFRELDYGDLPQRPPVEIDESRYPVDALWESAVPIHRVPWSVDLDRRAAGVRGAASRPPHSMLQELLNRADGREGRPDLLWGILTNGITMRLLRDNVALTRQAYVEFDLEAIFAGEQFADFAALWLTVHCTRLAPRAVEAAPADDEEPELPASRTPAACWLETWLGVAATDGTRALLALRANVEEAVRELGAGFLSHPANRELQEALKRGQYVPASGTPRAYGARDYMGNLLRVVYRLIFLAVCEDRDVLLEPVRSDDSSASALTKARDVYTKYYSLGSLRDLALKRVGTHAYDAYEQMRLVMGVLHEKGERRLALPALGSALWDPAELGPLADAKLTNRAFFSALRAMCSVEQDGVRQRVDFRHLGAEELGSVYESLLELHPSYEGGEFRLERAGGSDRKLTGAYYTPTSLIEPLLDENIAPLIRSARREVDPEAALLDLKVLDPACGSGHFLIAAGHRIATALAELRAEDDQPTPDQLRGALHDVVARCLYGIDINPMSVELCKVSLWLEGVLPGTPLSFLDHHVVCGNALVGATRELVRAGVPDGAFKAIGDDDPDTAKARKASNREARKAAAGSQLALLGGDSASDSFLVRHQREHAVLEAGPAGSIDELQKQREAFEHLQESDALLSERWSADAWCAAFFVPLKPDAPAITHSVVVRAANHASALSSAERMLIADLAAGHRFLHPHVAFPFVFDGERQGFDAVVGNPPWEQLQFDEQEFFSVRSPWIATAPTGSARKKRINQLKDDDPPLWLQYAQALRNVNATREFMRVSGRFPLTGRGRTNLYAVFAELGRSLTTGAGRTGFIVPTGIATDDTTKAFFADLIESGSLSSLYDFENKRGLFPAVESQLKFCILSMIGARGGAPAVSAPRFAFFLHDPSQISDPERTFSLTAADISVLNPNTKTCPVFRSNRDAVLVKQIYQRIPILLRRGANGSDPWGVRFKQGLFNMTSDSGLFRGRLQLERPDPDDELAGFGSRDPWHLEGNVFVRGTDRFLPLYEAKMIHHFDQCWATYETDASGNAKIRTVLASEKADPNFAPLPRYWVREDEVNKRLGGWQSGPLLGWRDVTKSVNERTVIVAEFPRVAVGNNLPISAIREPQDAFILAIIGSSFALDYVARFKVGGTHLNFFVTEQLPIPAADDVIARVNVFAKDPRAWLRATYAAARTGPGLPGRAARAALDALMFEVYGYSREDIEHALTLFPIVAKRDAESAVAPSTFELIRIARARLLENADPYDAAIRALRATP